jgi:hypothetical protein
VVSKHYTTVSVLRTIEEVLGLQPMGLNDALQPAMTEVFSQRQAMWRYTARLPMVLRSTKLPLPAVTDKKSHRSAALTATPKHDSTYWALHTQGFDFSVEDNIDSAAFNQVLWQGLKGNQPYPSERDGKDLSKNRRALIRKH